MVWIIGDGVRHGEDGTYGPGQTDGQNNLNEKCNLVLVSQNVNMLSKSIPVIKYVTWSM